MANIEQLEKEFNNMILQGNGMEAFEKFYAEDVVMQENTDDPTVGKDANRKREEEFFGNVEEVHNIELLDWAVNGHTSYGEWDFDLTFKDGNRASWKQVHRRKWNDDGEVKHERFYYKPDY